MGWFELCSRWDKAKEEGMIKFCVVLLNFVKRSA